MKNKKAIVTAATSGIGWASAITLAKEGATVCICAPQKDIDRIAELLTKCNDEGLDIFAIPYDAFDAESYKTLFDKAIERMGGLDILVNNFGYTVPSLDTDIFHIKYEDFNRFVTVNLASVIIPTQLALPLMMQRGGGSIVNIASIAGAVPDMTEMAYGTSKAAICHITKMVASQAAPAKIRCNAILPGLTMTTAVKEVLTEEYKQFFLRHVPLGRAAEPDEIAAAVKYFASDASSFVTGQLLEVSGGFGTATPLFADMMAMAVKMQG